jgi:CheY-like chemotaxis protein
MTPVILVVDDEALLRMLAADHFADAGFEVLEAVNGAEAMALICERPDIKAVVTDVQMPGDPDGFELARAVREACPDCAIVVVSGRAVPAAGDLAERARYVPKPYVGREIVRLVEGMLTH